MFSRTVQDWPLEATINCFAGVCRVSIPVLACDIAFSHHRFFVPSSLLRMWILQHYQLVPGLFQSSLVAVQSLPQFWNSSSWEPMSIPRQAQLRRNRLPLDTRSCDTPIGALKFRSVKILPWFLKLCTEFWTHGLVVWACFIHCVYDI